jgi:D-alanyl-D-alanine carboxypeptidase (penicillin-binding protein 5/6)
MPFLVFLLLFFINKAQALEILAKEAILVDFERGQILLEKNSTQPMYPSSMTKIMTSYLAFEAIKLGTFSLEDKFTVSNKAWKMGGSKMFLNLGDAISLGELLKGIIIVSGNDACITLAEGFYGDESLFAEKMNQKAKELAMNQTNFINSTGWPDPNHITTAEDLAKVSRALILDFPDFYHYHSLVDFTHNNIKQRNRNLLLGRGGVDGIKTGHTDLAGYGIVLSAKEKDRRIITVINGLTSEKARALEGDKIINYGFKAFKAIKLDQEIQLPIVELIYGEAKEVPIKIKKDFTLYARPNETFYCTIALPNKVKAPLFAREKLGTITCKVKNLFGDFIEEDLVVAQNIEKSGFFKRLIDNIAFFFTEKR